MVRDWSHVIWHQRERRSAAAGRFTWWSIVIYPSYRRYHLHIWFFMVTSVYKSPIGNSLTIQPERRRKRERECVAHPEVTEKWRWATQTLSLSHSLFPMQKRESRESKAEFKNRFAIRLHDDWGIPMDRSEYGVYRNSFVVIPGDHGPKMSVRMKKAWRNTYKR